MRDAFVELGRTFAVYQEREPLDEMVRRSYTASVGHFQKPMDWPTLLKSRLVVVLGEPGSGKSEELRSQHLLNPGSYILRLEQLVSEDIASMLSDEDRSRFNRWKVSDETALFLLDAVDESKLKRDDDFVVALDRLNNALGAARRRARLVISSRISEWRPHTDRAAVLERFAVAPDSSKPGATPSEHAEDPVLVVTMQPLTVGQVRLFAAHKGVRDADAFMHALRTRNAWALAGRPLDVSHLYDYWMAKGTLSNLTDLTEFVVTKLLAEVSNKERTDPLTPHLAREGAEFLAAAAVLCKNLNIEVSDDGLLTDDERLSPSVVLPDGWLPVHKRALLNRALFDSASRGALTFHHRTHVEYLAASWIERVMENNCGFAALKDILFADVGGETTLRSSLAPIAAWLVKSEPAPWRSRLADLILQTAPEIHLSQGDPAALSVEYRRRVLEAIVRKYGRRDYVGLTISLEALSRLADSSLEADISSYLTDSGVADGLKADLLMIVFEGKLSQCIPSVLSLFEDVATSGRLRDYSVLAIREAATLQDRRALAQSVERITELGNGTIAYLFEALFPSVFSVSEAVALLRRATSVSRYDSTFLRTVEAHLLASLDSTNAVSFLRAFLGMLSEPPLSESRGVSVAFYWVSDLLVPCLAVAARQPLNLSSDFELIFEGVTLVEHRIQFEGVTDAKSKEQISSIRLAFTGNRELVRGIFWKRVDHYRFKFNGNEPSVYALNPHQGLAPLSAVDVDWLLRDTVEQPRTRNRIVAVNVALGLMWGHREPMAASCWRLRSAFANSELRPSIAFGMRSRLLSPLVRSYQQHFKNRFLQRHWWTTLHIRAVQRMQWLHSREWLWTHVRGLSAGKYPRALQDIVSAMISDGGSRYGVATWEKVEERWGKRLTSAAKDGCRMTWETFTPLMPHERTDRNSTDCRVVLGLIALQTSWKAEDFRPERFTRSEVIRATRYALSELNGLPEWFQDLCEARTLDVQMVLTEAIEAEFNYPQNLEHVNEVLARLAWSEPIPMAASNAVRDTLLQREPINDKVLEQAVRTLLRSEENFWPSVSNLTPSRIANYTQNQPQWFVWMSAWLRLDAVPALTFFQQVLSNTTATDADELVITVCSYLGGRRNNVFPVHMAAFLTPSALATLIPLVNRHVRREEDIERANMGAYSPSPRDDAQDFRYRLWETLRASESDEADFVLRNLMNDEGLSAESSWILSILEDRQMKRADPVAWRQEDIPVFAQFHSHRPRSSYQLFELVRRLLLEVKADIEASENATYRLQVRETDLETDFQGFLHRELQRRSQEWFSVTQESTIDLAQRPDLRVETVGVGAVPVEVKLANLGWSIERLMERLEVQVVGQYLRAEQVNHAVYVIGNTSPTRYWISTGNGVRVHFAEVVRLLQARAQELLAANLEYVHGLTVIGIDFSDPRTRSR